MSSKKFGSRRLKGLRDFRVSPEITSVAIEEFLQALDCPRSLMIAILWRNSEFQQLSEIEFDPLHYKNLEELRDAYAATKFLSKYSGFKLSVSKDDVALQKFEEFELLCTQTNIRFRDLACDPLFKGRTVWLHNAIIRKIATILGEFTTEEFFSLPDWGPGASTLIKRRDASSVKKFQCETGVTRDLYNLIPLQLLEENYPLWSQQLNLAGFPTFQVGNRVITVPKDSRTNRVIAIEPGLNLFFQKSIGEMIRTRLQRCGVDLRFQDRNQQLARKGSITNALATVDLSSASDSIASSVAEVLLPPRWFALMDACRSHFGSQNTHARKWSKFSSMGNGFTFELESLIFYATAYCCTRYLHVDTKDVSAYGDDIILPSACFEIFSEMMTFYGFRINRKKSHYDSCFRESCGGHYFSGVDVKPIYLKDRLSSVLSLYRLANAIRRLAHRRNSNFGCDARLRKVFELLVQKTPSALRLRIPEHLGDGGFIGNFDESTPSRSRHGIEGYHVLNAIESSKTRLDDTVGYLLASLWHLPSFPIGESPYDRTVERLTLVAHVSGLQESQARLKATGFLEISRPSLSYNSVTMSGQVIIKVTRSLVQQWYDLGVWI